MTSSRCPRNVLPPNGRSALGDPMRDDSPAERMTAASTWRRSARNALGCSLRPGLRFCLTFGLGFGRLRRMLTVLLLVVLSDDGLMRQVCSTAADGNQLGRNADGDLFGREGADFKSHRGVDAVKEFGRKAFAFKRLIHREHLTLAADHAEIAGLGFDGPGE